MNLSLSNFAWFNNDADSVFKKLKEVEIDNVELILTKIKDWTELDIDDILYCREDLKEYGLKASSLQSLFYNVPVNSVHDKYAIVSHFTRLIDYSDMLGSKVLVFGSPNLRKKVDGWEKCLVDIFKTLDKILIDTDVQISIEPNLKLYGGEFFHSLDEIVDFIETNDFKNVKTMIDTHNVINEGYDPFEEIEKHAKHINHIHISELELKPLHDIDFHESFSRKIKNMNYNGIITYEVKRCDDILNRIEEFSNLYK